MKDKDQNIQDQAMLIVKLTGKVESNDETLSLLKEQLEKEEHKLKLESDQFDLKLRETHKYFDETLQELEMENKNLRELVQKKDNELITRENDLREVISRHERDIQRIMSRGEVDIHDEVVKMFEQKLKDLHEVLEGKIQVIGILQTEMSEKDKKILEDRETLKMLKDKLQVTSEQLMLMQASFVDTESQWKYEKTKLESHYKNVIEKHETETSEKDLQLQMLQSSLAQYEAAYSQASIQYGVLQERYQQAYMQLQKLGGASAVASSEGSATKEISSDQDELQALRTLVEQLKGELTKVSQKDPDKQSGVDPDEVEALKTLVSQLKSELSEKSAEIETLRAETETLRAATETLRAAGGEGGDKTETKHLKMKAQMTSRIKSLEKELQQLRKVRHTLEND